MAYEFDKGHESIEYGANIYDPQTNTYYKKSGSAVWKWIGWWLYLPCALICEEHFLSGKQVFSN